LRRRGEKKGRCGRKMRDKEENVEDKKEREEKVKKEENIKEKMKEEEEKKMHVFSNEKLNYSI
jgi:hypothetical protein